MVAITTAGGPSGRGTFRMQWRGAQVAASVDGAVERACQETAEAVKAEAQSRARVDTGAMRDSIETTVSGGSGRRTITASIGVDYGIYHELGTSRISAQPMLRPAIDQEAPKLTQRIRAAMGGG